MISRKRWPSVLNTPLRTISPEKRCIDNDGAAMPWLMGAKMKVSSPSSVYLENDEGRARGGRGGDLQVKTVVKGLHGGDRQTV